MTLSPPILLARADTEGQYHPPHTDTYTVSEDVTLLVTLITYLTDVEEGGETAFPDAVPAPVSISPKRGGLGVWFSCNPEGRDDKCALPRTRRARVDVPPSLTSTVCACACGCGCGCVPSARFSEHEGKKVTKGKKWTATYFVYNKPLPHCAEPVTLNAVVPM